MGISRATFARIYESARRKIAKALVERKEIKAVYGDVYFDRDWFICQSCMAKFTLPNREILLCPICKSENINSLLKL
jgi:Zn finger protein HypA/HybF involved in hydrogenase expression